LKLADLSVLEGRVGDWRDDAAERDVVAQAQAAVLGAVFVVAHAAATTAHVVEFVASFGVVQNWVAAFVDRLAGVDTAAVGKREVAVEVVVEAVGKTDARVRVKVSDGAGFG